MPLIVTAAAADLQLLSQTELRVAAGLESSDASDDDILATYGLRAASALASACGIARGVYDDTYAGDSPPLVGAAPLTLKSEGLRDTFRLKSHHDTIYLSRAPVSAIASVTENGAAVASSGYELDAAQGALLRLSGDREICWAGYSFSSGRVVVEYTAGWITIPDDLKGFAAELVGILYTTSGENSDVNGVSIPGVIDERRWVDRDSDNIIPPDMMSALVRAGYRKPVIA